MTPDTAAGLFNRIEKYVERIPEAGCWLWIGSTNNRGYGKIYLDGKLQLAHRAAYNLFKGDIAAEMVICHICDVKCCVNPYHLYQGSQRDNVRDSKARGQMAVGARNGNAKLTADQIREIRSMSNTSNLTKSEIGKLFGIARITVQQITSGRRWPSVI